MSLRRAPTRRGPNPGVAVKPKKGYENVEQGVTQLYPEPNSTRKTDMDIVFVPGLGAHPVLSFKSTTTDFNWMKEDGICRDFPNARILLYQSESSWTGAIKVKQFLSNLAQTLLEGLKMLREGENSSPMRPITFIGHSMGGLVIAKAICIAESRQDLFPGMFADIAGCAFFGTPFRGAEAASLACMLSSVGKKTGAATASKLLELMRPDDEGLNELRKEFVRLAIKISPKIEMQGFWEEHPTTIKDLNGMPQFLSALNIPLPKRYAEFVTRESAIVEGVMEAMGLAANHRDLVKFDSSKDERYTLVRGPLKRLINGSRLRVKNRHKATRGDAQESFDKARKTFDGAQPHKQRETIKQNTATSTWFPKEPEFLGWLAPPDEKESTSLVKKQDCLWVRGRDGRGKTSAALSVIEEIEKWVKEDEEEEDATVDKPVQVASRVYLIYFFCDKATDYGTAEELLKSLIYQLIEKQKLAAVHTNFLLKKKGRETQPLLTVENLWQVLQDILADDVFVGSRIYFVVNNLEALPQDAVSTTTLLSFLSSELEQDGSGRRSMVRWMLTSGQSWDIDQALRKPLVRLVDLEDEKYGDQVQLELRKHAQTKVLELKAHKNYSRALAYFASSVIGQRAQNTQWIDITCDHLEELPRHENDLQVRRLLEVVPQDLDALINAAWQSVFENNRAKTGEIKEMLRVLVLTYQDPTEQELRLLAGLDAPTPEQESELHDLILKCRPLIVLKGGDSSSESTVCFAEAVVKTHLLENAHKLLGLTGEDIKLQHGILGFRAFSHVLEMFDFPLDVIPEPQGDEAGGNAGVVEENVVKKKDDDDENKSASENDDDTASSSSGESSNNGEAEEEDDEDDDDDGEDKVEEQEEDEDPEAAYLKNIAEAYAVKHWLSHASQATADIAEALSLEDKFWEGGSVLRRRWLTEHNRLTDSFKYYGRSELTGLHIAAAIGFRQLVSALMDNGYDGDKFAYDSDWSTPLHYAAAFGNVDIVEELLDRGSDIDDGVQDNYMTPLHRAAAEGHVKVMAKLLQRGADPNANCLTYGGVICAAIQSGNCDAVKLLVTHNVSLVSLAEEEDEKNEGEKDKADDEDKDEDDEVDDDDDDDDDDDEDEDEDEEVITSPLALAAMRADLTVFEFLIKEYSDKLPPKEFHIALVKAAEHGRMEAFTRLFNDFEHTQEAKQDALDEASYESNWEIVSVLLDSCPDLGCDKSFLHTAQDDDDDDAIRILEAMWEYTSGGISPEALDESLYEATDNESERIIELLLRYGASANATGEEYGNALTAAAYDGTIDIIKMLLDAGADINSPDGWALQHAAGEGHVDVVNLLLERGANVNACSSHSNMPQGTALQAAVESGQSDIVDILLEHGADPNLGGGEFTHPIIAAASKGEEAIFKKLLDAKVDVTVEGGEYMSTPLTYAAIYLPTDSIRLILDAGADINHVDNEGDTALIVTAGLGDHETVRLLLDYGADVLVQNNEGLNAMRKALAADRPVCVKMLVEHVSDLMEAMRAAIESGDASVAAVVRSVQNKKQELNYDDPVVPEVPAEPVHDESRRSSVYGPIPPENEGHAVNPEPVAYHPEKIVVDDHQHAPSHGVTLQEPITRPSITPSGPSATSVHDLYSPAHEILDYPPDGLFRRQTEASTPTGGQPPGPIRRKPISGGKPPLYRPYQPNGSGENVRHSSPPEALANAFQAYQPLQPQAQQEPSPSTSPPSQTSPEPGFVPYAPGPVDYAQPDSEARRKSSRQSFMGMKVPWSDDRFG
ncbi:hypothetical protein ACHAP5_004288 [Fusarium lateritium]